MRILGHRRAGILVLLAWTLLLLAASEALGGDVPVTKTADTNDGTCDADCSLREAVGAAMPGDTIIIPPGVYTLAGSPITIPVAMTLQGAGADRTIIQAATAPGVAGYRVFTITATGTVALVDVTVRHGAIIGTGSGGAILWNTGSGRLEITRSKIVHNQINADGSPAGAASGGAMFLGAIELVITDSTLADNKTTARSSTNGGAASGGAVFGGTPITILRSVVARNGIDTRGDITSGAASGGAFFVTELAATNSTFSGNYLFSGASSGNLFFLSTVEVSSCTLADNFGTSSSLFNGTMTARNTILAHNEPANCGTILSDGYNLIADDTGCTITPAMGDQIGTEDAPIDPHLGPLADNGGRTETHALLVGSPAIDHGDPNGCEDENGLVLDTDQRGVPRPIGQFCDIGAYEADSAKKAPIVGWPALLLLALTLTALGYGRASARRRPTA